MKYLAFSNSGNLDVMGLILMGASTKRGNTDMIGEYGTGWKYALATLHRNKVPIVIVINGKKLSITTKEVFIKDQPFQMFRIDHKDANFTTDMGPDWKIWMAIREVYCNSLDEAHPTVQEVWDIDTGEREFDKTTVYIGITPAVREIIDSWMDYFCFERTDDVFDIPGKLKVFKKLHSDKSIIYRKGIKVAESDKKGCFDYDFYNVRINEIREADFKDVEEKLREHMMHQFNTEIVETVLKSEDTWEKELNFYSWSTIINKKAWREAIGTKQVVPSEYTDRFSAETGEKIKGDNGNTILKVPTVLAQLISNEMPEVFVLGFVGKDSPLAIPEQISEELNEKIDTAMLIVENAGIMKSGEYLVQVCEFTNSYTKASHKEKLISISNKCNDMGIADISVLIAKEIMLDKTSFGAASVQFENYLIAELINALLKT